MFYSSVHYTAFCYVFIVRFEFISPCVRGFVSSELIYSTELIFLAIPPHSRMVFQLIKYGFKCLRCERLYVGLVFFEAENVYLILSQSLAIFLNFSPSSTIFKNRMVFEYTSRHILYDDKSIEQMTVYECIP